MKSVLNFNPDDIIAKKGNTFRTRKSGATSNTILKTPLGFESLNNKRTLKYLSNYRSRLKNKRQFSVNQNLRISEEMINTMHKHHLSSGDTKLVALNDSKMKRLDNAKEEELVKEMSNFMEPREIISIFSMENRESSNNANKVINSVQLSTLSTNPKKREKYRKHQDEDNSNIPNLDDLKIEERQALIEENSILYDEELMLEEVSGGAGPNEAMYFGVDPIPTALMMTFEEAMQRQKEILDKSSKVNKYIMPVWDSSKHTKQKFYKKDDVDSNETLLIFKKLKIDIGYQ